MDTTLEVTLPPFEPWPKIARLSREMIVTEKLDGTNGQVCVLEDGRVIAGSRTRWIDVKDDNYGFARWVKEHEDELRDGLGVGCHFGEWWGSGIQRKYGMKEKAFSLFNTKRWTSETTPPCCRTVPILFEGPFSTNDIETALADLQRNGSAASPGFMSPEGVVIYHVAAGVAFKKTIGTDGVPKSLVV